MSFYPASLLSDREAFFVPQNHGGQLEDLAEQYQLDPSQIIDFSVNVNPLGMPDGLTDVLQEGIQTLHRYPDSESRHFRRGLAQHFNLPVDSFLAGNGASELIYLICRGCQPERVLIVQPTFSEYQRSALLTGAHVEHQQLTPDSRFQCDFAALIQRASSVRMLFLCNPNNPTGGLVPRSEMCRLVGSLPNTLVVVDEAFMDFVDDGDSRSVMADTLSYPNLIVLRSMTKLFAIPGLRLGYLVAQPELVRHLGRVKEPWVVNSLAQLAGVALLNQEHYIRQTNELIRRERAFLLEELSGIGWLYPYPASANFILIQIMSSDLTAAILNEKLLQRNLYVRNCSNFVGLDERFFRIAVRGHSENQQLLAALREIESDR